MSLTSYLNELVNQNHRAFKTYSNLRWMNSYQAMELEEQRNKLVGSFTEKVNWSFKNTKPWINSLSKGCQLCGEGQWSCLFITGLCNANCFYCPTSQQADHLPTTQQFEFETAQDYAAYINRMKFKGVSFSGGEPLLYFDRLVDYITTVRKECSPELYIWIYTNGKLFTREKAEILGKLGLDEIRFDIGATNYLFNNIKFAKELIPNITVEIPAVPEKLDLIKGLIPELIENGVTNLNLHQIRLTDYNASKLEKHAYTYLHGEAPVVAESELTALDIIRFVDAQKLNIGVNYCEFQYKNRFQKSAFRRKLAEEFVGALAWITEAGYLGKLVAYTDELPLQPTTISMETFLLQHQKYHHVDISFFGLSLQEKSDSIMEEFEIIIGNKTYLASQKPTGPVVILLKEDFNSFLEIVTGNNPEIPERDDLFDIWKHTTIETGFRDYI
jgi:hypothetical protein